MENTNTPWYKNWKIVTPIGVGIVAVLALIIGLSVGLTVGKGGGYSLDSKYSLNGDKIDSFNYDLKNIEGEYGEYSGNVEVSAFSNIEFDENSKRTEQDIYFVKLEAAVNNIEYIEEYQEEGHDIKYSYTIDNYLGEIYIVYDFKTNSLIWGREFKFSNAESKTIDYTSDSEQEFWYEEYSSEGINIMNMDTHELDVQYMVNYYGKETMKSNGVDIVIKPNLYIFLIGNEKSYNYKSVYEFASDNVSNLSSTELEFGDNHWWLEDQHYNIEYLIS